MSTSLKNKTILVTGGRGFLGSHLVSQLKKENPKQIIAPSSKEHDLRKQLTFKKLFKNVDIVIHLAANVGGIGYNQKYPGSLFYDNILMGAYALEEARLAKIEKFVGIGTICSYPKYTPIPFKEENLWNGYPEETNAPYGLAKKMLLVQGEAYKRQYGLNFIFLLPVNLYGPGDNFEEERSHVIPALITKFIEAKNKKLPQVTVWGTGNPTREFLYVEDAARGIILATKYYNKAEPINLGSSFEISIKELALLIGKLIGYNGKIKFDKSRPDGQPRRKLDVSKASREFKFKSEVNFHEGLQNTINWYLKNKKPL